MAFFDELKTKAAGAANMAADKAKELSEITKLKGEIAGQEREITAAFLEIGKKLYETEKDNPESPVAELCAKITGANTTIEELKGKLAALKAE